MGFERLNVGALDNGSDKLWNTIYTIYELTDLKVSLRLTHYTINTIPP